MGSKLWTKDYIIFCLSSLVMFFAFYSLISALPVYLHDELLARNWEVGFVLSAYALAAVLLRPFCGYALDAWGRKWVFMSGFLVFFFFSGIVFVLRVNVFACYGQQHAGGDGRCQHR